VIGPPPTASKKKVFPKCSMLPPPNLVFWIAQNMWVVSTWKMARSIVKSRCTLALVVDSRRWDVVCYRHRDPSVRHLLACCLQSLEVPLPDVRVASGPHVNEVLSTLEPQPSCLGSQSSHSGRPGTSRRRPHHHGHGKLLASPEQLVRPTVRSSKKHD
jgi:hypothetical protein